MIREISKREELEIELYMRETFLAEELEEMAHPGYLVKLGRTKCPASNKYIDNNMERIAELKDILLGMEIEDGI